MNLNDLINLNPWREMDRIQRQMNRLFDNAWTPERGRTYPALNMWTNEETIKITAELPGYNPHDIHLSVSGSELTIRGNRPGYELRQDETLHRQERVFGEFERTIRLPFEVESDLVEAKFQNGVLNITLPRAEADKPKKIQIKLSQ